MTYLGQLDSSILFKLLCLWYTTDKNMALLPKNNVQISCSNNNQHTSNNEEFTCTNFGQRLEKDLATY